MRYGYRVDIMDANGENQLRLTYASFAARSNTRRMLVPKVRQAVKRATMRRFIGFDRFLVWILALSATAFASDPYPFDKYPAEVFRGRPAAARPETVRTREFRSVISRGAKAGPNFSGHYAVVDWGCGTSCGIFVSVDSLSGKIYEPHELSNVELGLNGPVYRINSNLLVLANCPDPVVYGYKDCVRKFYNWNGHKLVLLRSESASP
jgi:hypothetical protein